ncbi:hypothetical protein RF11_11603 [Thelohanellus kitauei]|uniref:Uncharacterized protein n=1 Tax=Thelohanellus kitauei TaxID=669202 RepID=A0A0C2IKI4_THEKT|nr:hypothetical protein RF11_11603 [Thelohanellus kitauei]
MSLEFQNNKTTSWVELNCLCTNFETQFQIAGCLLLFQRNPRKRIYNDYFGYEFKLYKDTQYVFANHYIQLRIANRSEHMVIINIYNLTITFENTTQKYIWSNDEFRNVTADLPSTKQLFHFDEYGGEYINEKDPSIKLGNVEMPENNETEKDIAVEDNDDAKQDIEAEENDDVDEESEADEYDDAEEDIATEEDDDTEEDDETEEYNENNIDDESKVSNQSPSDYTTLGNNDTLDHSETNEQISIKKFDERLTNTEIDGDNDTNEHFDTNVEIDAPAHDEMDDNNVITDLDETNRENQKVGDNGINKVNTGSSNRMLAFLSSNHRFILIFMLLVVIFCGLIYAVSGKSTKPNGTRRSGWIKVMM